MTKYKRDIFVVAKLRQSFYLQGDSITQTFRTNFVRNIYIRTAAKRRNLHQYQQVHDSTQALAQYLASLSTRIRMKQFGAWSPINLFLVNPLF